MLVHWGREVEQGHPGVHDVEEDEMLGEGDGTISAIVSGVAMS